MEDDSCTQKQKTAPTKIKETERKNNMCPLIPDAHPIYGSNQQTERYTPIFSDSNLDNRHRIMVKCL